MDRKLKTNAIAIIKLPSKSNTYSPIIRCFVKSYNADERMYTVICLTNATGYKVGRSMLIKEKSIAEVEKQWPVLPDLRLWEVPDAIGFCAYEYGILCVAVGKLPSSDAWKAYSQRYKELLNDPNRRRLAKFLTIRKEYTTARSMPFHGKSKSRVVMRRLRDKEKMRNSNSRMSVRRSRATYYTPSQLVESQLSNKPPKRKAKKKKKKKVAVGDVVPVRVATDDLLSVSFYGSMESSVSYGYSLAPGTTSGRTSTSTEVSKKKTKLKNLEEGIPF